MPPFRMDAKRFFLTFPQCETPKDVAGARITAKWPDILGLFAIAAEHHAATPEDPVGGPHLHMLLHFKERLNIRSADFFDFICEKHGDYQVQKGTMSQAAKYLTKEDKEPLTFNCDLEALKRKESGVFTKVAELVKEGKSLEEIDEMMPGHVYPHKRKLEEYIEFQEAKRRKTQVPKKGYLELNDDTIEIGFTRAFRSTQYYIWGPPGIGKTSLINRLIEGGFRGFHLPYNGHWDDWSDDAYDFAYADEFTGQVKITEMNAFLDGSIMHLPSRFRNRKKNKNVPVFILSNRPFEDQYPNTPLEIKMALLSRLKVIHLQTHPTVNVTIQETPGSTPPTSPQTTTIP